MEEVRKKKNGQAGADGNTYLRTKRIELRVCQQEFQRIEQHAETSGYSNLAQYLRESGLTSKKVESPLNKHKEKLKWLYEINRIGNNINLLANKMKRGHEPDDEILLVLMQIMEMAEAVHAETKKNHDEVRN